MRVIIFDQMGNVLNKFGCSKHLEFPNGVVVNDRQEIFISDNRAHCVKVFDYEGNFLRQIGGEGKEDNTYIVEAESQFRNRICLSKLFSVKYPGLVKLSNIKPCLAGKTMIRAGCGKYLISKLAEPKLFH